MKKDEKLVRPQYPIKVRRIVKLRDERKLTFVQIAAEIGCTAGGAHDLYKRWRHWAQRRQRRVEKQKELVT